MQYNVIGDVMQCVLVQMNPGEEVKAEAGAMIFMNDGVTIDTQMTGGLLKGLGRMLAGSTLFFTHFRSTTPGGMVAFAAHYPGHVRELNLRGDGWICAKESFLFSTKDVDIQVALTRKVGFGFFGGAGFILQRLAGVGDAYIHGGGNFVEYDLAPGQRLKVDAGCVVAFQESVQYDVEFIGGIRNALFGGEGLFLVTLAGPGHIILSTMPFSRMAGAILAHGAVSQDNRGSALGGALGGILENL
ncbi:MAG TPA: TIGR00266 family protein [Chthonomonadaceae bacterium]|nr:TIGR00266 family protein [Chthonomonadaceae bacterium]